MSESSSIVLVVDDDISVRESLELLLRHEGFDVETFVSAQDFLGRSPVTVPSCLVPDMSLSDSTVSICRNALRWNGMRCLSFLSQATEIFP